MTTDYTKMFTKYIIQIVAQETLALAMGRKHDTPPFFEKNRTSILIKTWRKNPKHQKIGRTRHASPFVPLSKQGVTPTEVG